MKELEFFFDYASPFSYLAHTQVEHLVKRTHSVLVYRPFLLGGLFKHHDAPLVPLHGYPEAKRHYYLQDLERWAHHWEVPFKWPTRFPLNSVKALRLTLAVDDFDQELLIDRIFTAAWVEDRDISDPGVLGALMEECELDTHVLARLDAVETKASLRYATDEAIHRGLCGAPGFGVDGRLFWGQDRLHFVEAALNGWRPVSERPDQVDAVAAPES